MKQALSKEKTIVTNVATLWALVLLLISLSGGWFNLTNQVNNLESYNKGIEIMVEELREEVIENRNDSTAAQINLAEINTRLTSIDAALLEIKTSLAR